MRAPGAPASTQPSRHQAACTAQGLEPSRRLLRPSFRHCRSRQICLLLPTGPPWTASPATTSRFATQFSRWWLPPAPPTPPSSRSTCCGGCAGRQGVHAGAAQRTVLHRSTAEHSTAQRSAVSFSQRSRWEAGHRAEASSAGLRPPIHPCTVPRCKGRPQLKSVNNNSAAQRVSAQRVRSPPPSLSQSLGEGAVLRLDERTYRLVGSSVRKVYFRDVTSHEQRESLALLLSVMLRWASAVYNRWLSSCAVEHALPGAAVYSLLNGHRLLSPRSPCKALLPLFTSQHAAHMACRPPLASPANCTKALQAGSEATTKKCAMLCLALPSCAMLCLQCSSRSTPMTA